MKNTNKKGFTIVELIIVIAILAVLAAVLIPTFANLIKKADDSAVLQERTNKRIEDEIEKLNKANYLTWEQFEAELAKQLAQLGDNTDNQEEIKKAVEEAFKEYLKNQNINNTGLTEDQVKKIVEKALEGQLTTAQVEAIVDQAIKSIPAADSLTPEQVKSIVDKAIAKLPKQTGITAEEMQNAITAAINELKEDSVLTEEQVTAIIGTELEKALKAFSSNLLTAEQIKQIIEEAIASANQGITTLVGTGAPAAGNPVSPGKYHYDIDKLPRYNSEYKYASYSQVSENETITQGVKEKLVAGSSLWLSPFYTPTGSNVKNVKIEWTFELISGDLQLKIVDGNDIEEYISDSSNGFSSLFKIDQYNSVKKCIFNNDSIAPMKSAGSGIIDFISGAGEGRIVATIKSYEPSPLAFMPPVVADTYTWTIIVGNPIEQN